MTFAGIIGFPQHPTLTKREQDVVLGLRAGQTSKQIAGALGLSPMTIKDARARLLKKFKAAMPHEIAGKFTNLEGKPMIACMICPAILSHHHRS